MSNRVGRHLAYVSEFTTDLRYIEGEQNVMAEALSRPSTVPPAVVGTPVAPSHQVSAPLAARPVPNAELPLRGRPWLQVVDEVYQQPGFWHRGWLGSSDGSLLVSASPAAQKRSVAELPQPGHTQLFPAAGLCPQLGSHSVSPETVGGQACLPGATSAPLPVSALPVAVLPIKFAQMAALQSSC